MGKRRNPIINTLRTEWEFLGKRKKIFALYIALFSAAGLVSLATPYLIGTIFNDIQKTITTQDELFQMELTMSMLLVVTIVFWIFHGFARILEQRTGFFVKRNYVNDKISKVLDLPTKWHKDHHSGDTIDKINQGSSAIEDFSSHITFQVVRGVVSFLGAVVIMFFIDWRIGLFALVFSAVTIYIISLIDKRLDKKYQELNRYNNRYSATVYDYLSNIGTIISLRLKRVVSKEVDSRMTVSYGTYKSTVNINEMKWALASIAIQGMVVAALIYKASSDFALTGTILIGSLYMVYGYLNEIGETFYRFADLYGNIIRMNARIVGAYPLDKAYRRAGKRIRARLPKKWKKIELSDVSFTYQKGKVKHLDHINFVFSRGEKIALVGESGSGKSTMLALIRGLYGIDSGRVYCDGKPLEELASVREHVTLIPQDPEIFNKTVRYNITMNLPVSEANLEKVLAITRLGPVIDRLPKRLETNVMEKGVSLSGGEKQRLALARGLLASKGSDILLLDEPTSSVDNMNEAMIYDQIFSKFASKTIIASVHRLHLLGRFDHIYLFSKGRIVGEGTYGQMKHNPLFRRMLSKYGKREAAPKTTT
jgi:ABC-type multidrug transport system fused ATPase/permease subunit